MKIVGKDPNKLQSNNRMVMNMHIQLSLSSPPPYFYFNNSLYPTTIASASHSTATCTTNAHTQYARYASNAILLILLAQRLVSMGI